jgi:type II secretory pathway component PulK
MTRATLDRRGVALVLVLWVLVLLGGIAAGVTAGTRTAGDATVNLRARAVARYMAESGVVAAVHAVDRALLAAADDSVARRAALNAPERTIAGADSFALGEGTVQVAIVDASARLDVNAATEAQLAALFVRTGSPVEAPLAARAIRAHVDGDARGARLLRSLDELRRIPGVSESLARAAAPYLTVDGDGRINRVTAPAPVLAAAAGELQDEPSRLVVVARGWQRGHPLTHELQAVYAVQGTRLVFVHWRERDL